MQLAWNHGWGLPQLGWSACPNLDQEELAVQRAGPGATAQKLFCQIPIRPLYFFFLKLSFSSCHSFLFSSFSDDLSGNPGTPLAHPPTLFREPQTTPALGAHWVGQNLRTPCCSGTGWQQLQGPPPPSTQFSQV